MFYVSIIIILCLFCNSYAQLTKDSMLRFGRTEGYPVPPSCLVTVCALSGPNTEEYFKYEVPIVGVVSHTKEIAIIRFLKTLATTNTLGTIVYSSNIQKIPPDI